MSDRKPYVGGNWKMNLNGRQAADLARALADRLPGAVGDKVEVVVTPPLCYLEKVAAIVDGSSIRLGAQNVYHQPDGAFTGEVSLAMLKDLGVGTVLVGHSERRHVLGESDVLINAKVRAVLEAGLGVILCIGETLEQRELGQTRAINWGQLGYGLAGVTVQQMGRMTIAYEPVWAIGTGKTATPDDAQKAHQAIRAFLTFDLFNQQIGAGTRIQYGGSVKPANAAELIAQPDVDGFLVGGASLAADDFVAIVEAAGG